MQIMNETFIANIKKAIQDHSTLEVGGGTFSGQELKDVLFVMEAYNNQQSTGCPKADYWTIVTCKDRSKCTMPCASEEMYNKKE